MMKREVKDVKGKKCIRGIDARLGVNDTARGRIRKQHIEKIKNEEND